MLTSESVIENIFKEIGAKRAVDTTPHVLSKNEMKDILCYIVDLKNENKKYRAVTSLKTEIIEEVITSLQKGGGVHD